MIQFLSLSTQSLKIYRVLWILVKNKNTNYIIIQILFYNSVHNNPQSKTGSMWL